MACTNPFSVCILRGVSAKLWLDPDVRIAENLGYGRQEYREIERIARQHVDLLRSEWDGFCSHFQIAGAGYGIHWPDLDEDIRVDGLLLGKKSTESAASFVHWLAGRSSAA